MSNGIGRVWAVNAEGGDEGRPNGVGPVYIENADQLGSKLPEPAAGDAGKVLGVLNSSGDIGWVEDQSGTLTQVQSDWAEDDSSQVSYIQNKPTLATVATSGSYADLSNKPTIPTVDQAYDAASANAQSGVAVAGAISGKQDTISDLESIRSGAAAGATAVQPSALATVATSGSYNDLTNKPTIPAAQVQSDWNQTNDQAVDFIKNKPTIPAGVVVDQSYSASSTNAQSGTAVAGAISAVNQVPASTSADEDKVLTVDSNGDAVWAVAQGGGSSYTAGEGIDISAQDEISVKAGNGITIADYTYEHTGTINLTATPVLNQGSYSATYIAQLTPDLLAKMNSTGGLQVTLNGAYDGAGSVLLAGLATNATTFQDNLSNRVVFEPSLGTSIAAGTTVTFDFAERSGSLSTKSYADVAANVSSYYLVIIWYFSSGSFEMFGNSGQAAPSADPITTGTYTGTETVTVQNAVNLSTPIPAVTGNAGKVLSVNSGATGVEWINSVPIEVVASLPASPTSGVLYIVTGS